MGISKKISIAIILILMAQDVSAAEDRVQDLQCLAKNIYFEGRNQPWVGQLAIAQVTLNRVKSAAFPATICQVVKQQRKEICQFSWYCDGKADEIISKENNHAWRVAQDIAFNIMVFDKYSGLVEGATHYHADYVNPRWARDLQLVGRIGVHIFYRWEK